MKTVHGSGLYAPSEDLVLSRAGHCHSLQDPVPGALANPQPPDTAVRCVRFNCYFSPARRRDRVNRAFFVSTNPLFRFSAIPPTSCALYIVEDAKLSLFLFCCLFRTNILWLVVELRSSACKSCKRTFFCCPNVLLAVLGVTLPAAPDC